MPALQRALALAEIDDVPMFICQNLYFDVARVEDRLFDIDLAVAEGALRLAAR